MVPAGRARFVVTVREDERLYGERFALFGELSARETALVLREHGERRFAVAAAERGARHVEERVLFAELPVRRAPASWQRSGAFTARRRGAYPTDRAPTRRMPRQRRARRP